MMIRQAETRDARAIARIHVRGWQIGYKGLLPDEYLARLTVEERTNRWLASQASPQRLEHLVAEDDDELIVGWAAYGRTQGDLDSDLGELAALYVDPDHWSRGIGAMLLSEAEAGLRLAGYGRAVLWTLTANERTRRFYEQHGWTFDGTTDTHPSGADVVRYTRELANRVDPGPGAA